MAGDDGKFAVSFAVEVAQDGNGQEMEGIDDAEGLPDRPRMSVRRPSVLMTPP